MSGHSEAPRHPDGTPDLEAAEADIASANRSQELRESRPVYFDIKGSRAGKVLTAVVAAAAIKGGAETLGPVAYRAGERIGQARSETDLLYPKTPKANPHAKDDASR